MVYAPHLPSISKSVASHFADRSRIRGQAYFVRGHVTIKDASKDHANAVVRGTRSYRVEITLTDRELVVRCDCPLEGTCKHMWATLLEAERQSFLGRLRSDPPSSFRIVRPPQPKQAVTLGAIAPPNRPSRIAPIAAAVVAAPPSPPAPPWKQFLGAIPYARTSAASSWQAHEYAYVIERSSELLPESLSLRLYERKSSRKDFMGPWRPLEWIPGEVRDDEIRRVLSLVRGIKRGETQGRYTYYAPSDAMESSHLRLSGEACEVVLSRLAAARMLFRLDGEELAPLDWDGGPPWEGVLVLVPDGDSYQLGVTLRRRVSLESEAIRDEEVAREDLIACRRHVIVLRDRVAKLSLPPECVEILARSGPLDVPAKDIEPFLQAFYAGPRTARLEVPEEFALTRVDVDPRPRAHLGAPKPNEDIPIDVAFQYGDVRLDADDRCEEIVDMPRRRRTARNRTLESAALRRLTEVGVKRKSWGERFSLPPAKAPKAIRLLLADGWHVEATGKLYRASTGFSLRVASGVDWFDVNAVADYDGVEVTLPSLIAAVRRGETVVTLDDGTFGLVPEEWLARWKVLADLGQVKGGGLRFERTQVGLLDVILEPEPEVQYDEAFTKLRDELRTSFAAEPRDQPKGFRGQLRDYQRVGLGWMDRLARSGFGGCLADDMGLGKTIQVLAWLLDRKASGEVSGPSLVVAPRSLIFNWKDEATRFAPQLTILDHTGNQREATAEAMAGYDIVLTTYGTLRRDALELCEIDFDYVILDEAQTIKNSDSAAFKSARALKARHRLALTGTPLENHVGELFTLFEFLNPSMLGRAHKKAGKRQLDAPALAVVGRALRPFLLRRTKQEVIQELPEKTEKTLYCVLGSDERRLYDELAKHYRDSLLGRIAKTGMKRAAFHVLEALLRLRQAACHPGLVDKLRASESSAKIETLLAELGSVVAEGHKALVFSQFTSLLAIVRERLVAEGTSFEYLDGQTRDRAAPVARFQNDENCKVFLISLKAGGLGLNLTAAEYVFILDPWWNPAVEAQAVDRAHRIGQSRPVFAYRIIARGTVEEKVAELQRTKAAMAQAILTAGDDAQASGSVLADLSLEELTGLLS
jgi:superfamily II DNA or RNA helicase